MKRLTLHKRKSMKYIWQARDCPNLTWQSDKLEALLGKARFSQGELVSRVRNLGLHLSAEARSEVLVNEAVKTSAIEGTRVIPAAVRSSVARCLGLSSAGLPPSDRY